MQWKHDGILNSFSGICWAAYSLHVAFGKSSQQKILTMILRKGLELFYGPKKGILRFNNLFFRRRYWAQKHHQHIKACRVRVTTIHTFTLTRTSGETRYFIKWLASWTLLLNMQFLQVIHCKTSLWQPLSVIKHIQKYSTHIIIFQMMR